MKTVSGLCRCYGRLPWVAGVIHGGPGAAGEMAPVAAELSRKGGVVEPLQSAGTVDGQIRELASCLREMGNGPFTLIGFSWGAWLAWLTVSRHPELVNKLVLVGSGPFESLYAEGILEKRLKRLSEGERAARNRSLARLGELMAKADAFDPFPPTDGAFPPVEIDADIFSAVWPEADEMRRSGRLLGAGKNIRCPVTAIHGAYDPHPAEGVEIPLSAVLKDFRFILLPQCGHRPWIERHARDRFFQIL
ncbi:MAG: alpha/beta hydrolase [Acidobacteriota bacterium]